MAREYNDIRKSALKDVAEFMCVAARTAPKACGVDNLVIIIPDMDEKKKIVAKMNAISEEASRPSLARDAVNIAETEHIVIIGTKKSPLKLNCGFCGYTSCDELSKTKGVCAYNSMDLGIAIGSAVSLASNFHADNRLMYSIGRAAMEAGVLGKEVIQAIGIPLSATGKNPFFDRK